MNINVFQIVVCRDVFSTEIIPPAAEIGPDKTEQSTIRSNCERVTMLLTRRFVQEVYEEDPPSITIWLEIVTINIFGPLTLAF